MADRTPTSPTGIFLGHLKPGTPEWEAARAGLCVTGTEIAAVVGLSPWMSRFTLWHKKAGLPTGPREANPAMRWGLRFEDDVEDEFIEQHPEWYPMDAGTWRHRERSWQRCTPDRLLYRPHGDPDYYGAIALGGEPDALLEVKTSPYGDDFADGLPVHYRAQILWQLDTLGLKACHVALLILSGLGYREFVVEWDADEAALLRKEAAEFLRTVEAGERPPIDAADDTYQTIRAQHEGREDVEVEIPAELGDRYEATGEALREAKDARQLAAAEVLDAIGDGRYAAVAGRRIAQRTTRNALQPCKQKASTP